MTTDHRKESSVNATNAFLSYNGHSAMGQSPEFGVCAFRIVYQLGSKQHRAVSVMWINGPTPT